MEMQQFLQDAGLMFDEVGTTKDNMKHETQNFRVDLLARNHGDMHGVGKRKKKCRYESLKKKKKGHQVVQSDKAQSGGSVKKSDAPKVQERAFQMTTKEVRYDDEVFSKLSHLSVLLL
ncbi:unnamed protein product [Lactuca saligna]|uniref:Uncharacterized protein n=1 Tax=Lactuca saligna TaxID=75948 RepID=A0AA35ZLI8_LACSI|nr:unnamed protein product [Lactuca saligna]